MQVRTFPIPILFAGLAYSPKSWNFTIGFGGSSNCWAAGVPRMLPNDFRLKSLNGVGYDWPVSYDNLASYYDEVEDVMSVSGPRHNWPFPWTIPDIIFDGNDLDQLVEDITRTN
jgi:choline dehydrogenase-like flavoprotein